MTGVEVFKLTPQFVSDCLFNKISHMYRLTHNVMKKPKSSPLFSTFDPGVLFDT